MVLKIGSCEKSMIPLDIYFLQDVFYYFQWKQGALCTELLITGGLMVGWMRRLLYFKEKNHISINWEETGKRNLKKNNNRFTGPISIHRLS